MRLAGAVLTGGRSRRMGRDKATLVVGGLPLARRVADVLVAAGAEPVVCVGGDEAGLAEVVGLEVVPDPVGEGPLPGLAAALHRLAPGADAVAVLACDLLAPEPAAVRALVAALDADGAAEVAVPVADGVRQALHAVWRAGAAPAVDDAVAAGERSVQAVLDRLRVAEVDDLDPAWLRDADRPADLDP